MIIAVCGNSSSGKSTLAVKIATMFASRKKNTALIDTDFITPQFNVWYPKKEMFNHTSLAVLLDNNVDIETTADKMHIINENLASKRLAERVGFKLERIGYGELEIKGKMCDIAHYIMNFNDYETMKEKNEAV